MSMDNADDCTQFIKINPDESKDLIVLRKGTEDHVEIYYLDSTQDMFVEEERKYVPVMPKTITYTKYMNRFGNYLIPEKWELKVIKKVIRLDRAYNEIYLSEIKNFISCMADRRGIKLLKYLTNIEYDRVRYEVTITVTALGYIKHE